MSPILRSGGIVAGMAAINVLTHRTRLPGDLVVPAGALAVTAAARASGLRCEEMGMTAAQLKSGLLPGAISAAATAAVVAAVAQLPQADSLSDGRYDSRAEALRAALLTTPLAVAVPEEVLFRGVLDASLRRHLSRRSAALLGSVLFGAWHILGARTSVAGTVAATSAAGLGFQALRTCTDSIAAPVAVHWALNGTAALATSWTAVTK